MSAAGAIRACAEGLGAEPVTSDAALEALADEWWGLWRRIPEATPFQSPAWLLPWWRCFHPGDLATVAIRQAGRLVGLAPLYREEDGRGGRLLPLGIAISDSFDILAEPDLADPVATSLSDAVADAPGWRRLDLEELPPGAAALELPCPPGCREEQVGQSVSPVLVLPPAGRSVVATLTPKNRRSLALARNRAARIGGVEFGEARESEAQTFLDTLFRLHAACWKARGEPGVLAAPELQRFHRSAAPALLRAGLARFYVARMRGEIAAMIYALVRGGRLMLYVSAFDPLRSYESPGALLLAHVIERAQAEGMREVDFLRGQEAYKYVWNPVERVNVKRSFMRGP